jgi:uncharacterized protein YjiS (DUF1127 family)
MYHFKTIRFSNYADSDMKSTELMDAPRLIAKGKEMSDMIQAVRLPARPQLPGLLPRLVAMMALNRQRARLAQLDDAQLRDIGLTRAEADAEANRPFWDAPAHWMGGR